MRNRKNIGCNIKKPETVLLKELLTSMNSLLKFVVLLYRNFLLPATDATAEEETENANDKFEEKRIQHDGIYKKFGIEEGAKR